MIMRDVKKKERRFVYIYKKDERSERGLTGEPHRHFYAVFFWFFKLLLVQT